MENNKNKPRVEINAVTGAPEIIIPITEEQARQYAIEFTKEPAKMREIIKKISPFNSALAFLGKDKEETNNLFKLENEGIALFPIDQQHKIDRQNRELVNYIPTPPKLVEKNLDALAGMLQKINAEREREGLEKTGEFEFTFKEYALERGYSEEEITRSGGFIDELKKDLISGGRTTYSIPIKKDGKNYIRHGFPSFYILDEPLEKKAKWYVSLNEPYKSFYLNEGQFYPVLTEAIKDRSTTGKKDYLYSFHKFLLRKGGAWKGKKRYPHKIVTLLEEIGVANRARRVPKRSFDTLKDCIEYANSKGLIQEIKLESKADKLNLSPETFLAFDYEDFKKKVLAPLDLEDIRKVLISFNTSQVSNKEGEKEVKEEVEVEMEKGGSL